MIFIDKFVQKRKEKRFTQAHVAIAMKTTASAIARLESGGGKKQHSPSVSTLKKYADFLGCDLDIKLIERN